MSSIDPLLKELFAMTFHSGIKPGLSRVEALCEKLDFPYRLFSSIHVAGTNGKGSTCSMLASILQTAGYKVGLYTSPHVRMFNERVRVNGAMISDQDIARIARPLMEAGKEIGATFFEITTALAFQYFKENRVDVAVIETGLGGRLDATNVIEPILSVITSIDYDHMEYLGTTLESIASEKAGIIKPSVPVVIGQLSVVSDQLSVVSDQLSVVSDQLSVVSRVFEKQAMSVDAPLVFANDVVKVEIDKIHPDLTMSVSVIDGEFLHYYETSMAGAHQAQNVATVFAALPFLRDLYFITEDHVRNGLRNVQRNTGIEGRIQRLSSDPLIVLDVSHNPAGIKCLVDTLSRAGFRENSWHVVFGGMRDKDILGMLERLKPLVATIHLCSPDHERALSPQGLEQLAVQAGYSSLMTHDSVAGAVERATLRGQTLICGSFYVADEAIRFLRGN